MFEIVKQSINKWDCMDLLEFCDEITEGEYYLEINEIVPIAYRTNCSKKLAKTIVKIFFDYFDTRTSKRQARKVAQEILENQRTQLIE